MSPPPRVSILMGVYNGARFLEETLAGVFAQDFDDFELVAVDDGSSDDSPDLLARWARREPRLRPQYLPRNGGISAALNHALAQARGRYVAPQDADDVPLPGRLAAQVALLERDPGVVLVGADCLLVDQRGRRLGRMRSSHLPPEAIAFLLHFGNAVFGHSQWLLRRADLVALGGYDETLPVSVDYALATRLARRGRIVMLPCVGMRYRVHPASHGHRLNSAQLRQSSTISRALLEELLERPLDPAQHDALMAVWRQQPCADPAAAARLLDAAWERFAAGTPPSAARAAVRGEIARQWTRSALHRCAAGAPVEGLRYFGQAWRWRPATVLEELASQVRRLPGRIGRAVA